MTFNDKILNLLRDTDMTGLFANVFNVKF